MININKKINSIKKTLKQIIKNLILIKKTIIQSENWQTKEC